MEHGFPADEVRPLSCTKYERSDDVFDIDRNDVLGNYSVTFVDSITTFAILGDVEKFEQYIKVIREIDFNIDSTVQVFETSIRALGSLLSAHLYAQYKFQLPNYDGFLLRKAHDLGRRLIRAYTESPNGIPVARVNLQTGVEKIPKKLIEETCTAGAGSPMLELTLLSILTNDTLFETVSRDAYFSIWNARSPTDLVPMSLNPLKGKWLSSITGIGASIDSFYEYALKGAILFDDSELMTVWKKSYQALMSHAKMSWFMTNVHADTAMIVTPWVDALSAFFPGLLVLSGKVENAMTLYMPFLKLWDKYGGIPERWDYIALDAKSQVMFSDEEVISLEWYPLRPEFIESTYYLYRATKDPVFLRIGEQILEDYETVFKAPCGFAGYRDIRTKEMQDRMESFVLSETFMYLYLLFDEDNELNNDERIIFSTEGHPFWLPSGVLSSYRHFKQKQQNDLDVNIEKSTTSNDSELSWDEKVVSFLKGLFDDYDSHSLPPIDENVLGTDAFSSEECSPVISTDGFFSQFLEDPNSFVIDSKFKSQFGSYRSMVVDEAEFYSVFAPPNAMCNREYTTAYMNFNFGEISDIKNCHLRYSDPDFTVMSLNGLVLKLELLKYGQIDTRNEVIDSTFLNQYAIPHVQYDLGGICTPEDELFANSVFRISTVNGIDVGPQGVLRILFTERAVEKTSKGMVKIINDKSLAIKDVLITNLEIETVL